MQPEDLQAVADVIAQAIHEALSPLLTRLDAIEASLEEAGDTDKALGDLRERVAVVETKADRPPAPIDVTPVLAQLAHELRGEFAGVVGGVMQDVVSLRERAAVLETRAPVPGPAGVDGKPGIDGTHGKDGFSLQDFSVALDGDRTLVFKFTDGVIEKLATVQPPWLIDRGVYQESKAYDAGDVVTWGGSSWTCQESTHAKPGEGSNAWRLCVKKGRDGRDGKDGAPAPLPVVKVGA